MPSPGRSAGRRNNPEPKLVAQFFTANSFIEFIIYAWCPGKIQPNSAILAVGQSWLAGRDSVEPKLDSYGRSVTARRMSRPAVTGESMYPSHEAVVHPGNFIQRGSLGAFFLGRSQFKVQFAQLFCFHPRGRVGHQVGAFGRLGEGNDVADAGAPQSMATMRSKPRAMPPCGGAPYLKASSM